jgi:peptidylprolyl isomerase
MIRLIAAALALVAGLSFAQAQTPAQDPQNTVVLTTKDGRIVIRLRPDLAPKHVEQIKTLTKRKFYDGIVFHRVIDGFMAQTGDPTGTGSGGSGRGNVQAEFSRVPFDRGIVGAARAQSPNSADSQFFIMFRRNAGLDGQYTVWGQVISGMEFVDRIKRGEPPRNPDKMIRVQVAADVPN